MPAFSGTRLQARDYAHVVLRALNLGVGPAHWRPKVGLVVEYVEIRRHYTDDGLDHSIHAQGAPDRGAIVVVPALPITGTDQQDWRRVVHLILVFRQNASQDWLDPKGLKHGRRIVLAIDSLRRLPVLVRADVTNVVANGSHRLEGLGFLAERVVVDGHDAVQLVLGFERNRPDHHHPVGIRKRKRAKQSRVNKAEDDGIRPDAQRQR